MIALLIFSGLVIIAFLSIQWVSLYAIKVQKNQEKTDYSGDWPKVSVLLAARDEEDKIIRSLTHLNLLDYPVDKIEIWIGDDQSEDRTVALIQEFIAGKPQFHLVSIHENLGKGRGKANVLAHLAHKAKGDFFFITDVDVALPQGWIKGLLSEFAPEVGIVSGTTYCATGTWFETMQSIDWLHFMGYIKAFANIGVSCTSVGNNMAVRATAYWQTGGYETMDFSITEDYRLFEEVTKNGWKWRNVLSSETLGKATAISSVLEMLHQRKRWLIGGRDLPINWKAMIVLYGLFRPTLVVLACYYPGEVLGIWALKILLQSIFIHELTQISHVKKYSTFHLLWYELYDFLNVLATAFFYLLPFKTRWKRRTYSHQDLNE